MKTVLALVAVLALSACGKEARNTVANNDSGIVATSSVFNKWCNDKGCFDLRSYSLNVPKGDQSSTLTVRPSTLDFQQGGDVTSTPYSIANSQLSYAGQVYYAVSN